MLSAHFLLYGLAILQIGLSYALFADPIARGIPSSSITLCAMQGLLVSRLLWPEHRNRVSAFVVFEALIGIAVFCAPIKFGNTGALYAWVIAAIIVHAHIGLTILPPLPPSQKSQLRDLKTNWFSFVFFCFFCIRVVIPMISATLNPVLQEKLGYGVGLLLLVVPAHMLLVFFSRRLRAAAQPVI